MVKCRIDQIEVAWRDNGHTMWNILYTRLDTGYQYYMRTWAKDELDAYKIATTKLGADE